MEAGHDLGYGVLGPLCTGKLRLRKERGLAELRLRGRCAGVLRGPRKVMPWRAWDAKLRLFLAFSWPSPSPPHATPVLSLLPVSPSPQILNTTPGQLVSYKRKVSDQETETRELRLLPKSLGWEEAEAASEPWPWTPPPHSDGARGRKGRSPAEIT